MTATTDKPRRARAERADRPQGRCRCGRVWDGIKVCHCSAPGCHQTFSSIAAFDKHRVHGQCRDPKTLTRADGNPTLMQVDRVRGPVWITWQPEEQRNRKWWQELEEA